MEIPKVNVDASNIFMSNAYPGDGLYFLEDGSLSVVNGPMIVNSGPLTKQLSKKLKQYILPEQESRDNGVVSENFALKAIAVVAGNSDKVKFD